MRDWRVQTALDKYGQGSITLPRAAELAGISIYEMIAILEERKIPYRYDLSDLEEYLKKRNGNTVSDSTTIVNIAKVGKLQLLKSYTGTTSVCLTRFSFTDSVNK